MEATGGTHANDEATHPVRTCGGDGRAGFWGVRRSSHAEARQYRRYHFVCERVKGTYRLEES